MESTLHAFVRSLRALHLVRRAELRFAHPYAVVAAVAAGDDDDVAEHRLVPRAWDGLPVFSAWVAEPEEADVSDLQAADEEAWLWRSDPEVVDE